MQRAHQALAAPSSLASTCLIHVVMDALGWACSLPPACVLLCVQGQNFHLLPGVLAARLAFSAFKLHMALGDRGGGEAYMQLLGLSSAAMPVATA